jgi:hypothetical protein
MIMKQDMGNRFAFPFKLLEEQITLFLRLREMLLLWYDTFKFMRPLEICQWNMRKQKHHLVYEVNMFVGVSAFSSMLHDLTLLIKNTNCEKHVFMQE